jgi:phage tail-like protein
MSDANGQRFWMLSEATQWRPQGNPPGTAYDLTRRRLRLASQRMLPLWPSRWTMQVILPGDTAEAPIRSNAFTFTAQPAASLQITTVEPVTLRVSDEATDLRLRIPNLGEVARATVTLGFPDGRYMTRAAIAPLPEDTGDNTLILPVILNQAGAWSLRLTLPDGRQSPPYHFTVLAETAPAVEISSMTPASIPLDHTSQTLTFSGQGFQVGMGAVLTLPGGQLALGPDQLQAVTETSFDLNLNLSATEQTVAVDLLHQVPQTRDQFGTYARWDIVSNRVVATGAGAGDVGIYLPPAGHRPTDLALGYDGVLYVALYNSGENTGQIVMVDRRDRWPAFTVPLPPGFVPWRLAADPGGGVWVLNRRDQPRQELVRVQGYPLPSYADRPYGADTFRPCDENPDPPRADRRWSGTFEAEAGVAIAVSPTGQLALLSWVPGAQARVRLWAGDCWYSPLSLDGARYPFSLQWQNAQQIALLLPGLTTEAVVYALPADLTPAQATDNLPILQPTGNVYPLRHFTGEPLLNGMTQPPHYPASPTPAPLLPLSLKSFSATGTADAIPLDSQNTQTIWHRLYLEAVIPPQTGIRIFLATSDQTDDSGNPLEPAAEDWFEHRFGQRFAAGAQIDGDPAFDRQIPLGAWVSQTSEIPYHSGLLGCPIEKNRIGLFTVLIQRSGRRVRSLQGRYLWVRVDLKGNGRTTPEIAALRAYGSRFSYLNQYLPALYQESLFGPDADVPGNCTPADFLERFLDNFEGILTPLEDRIARADLLTDARTVPAESLDWLGSWIGVTFDSAYPSHRRRALLRAAPQLRQQHGTLNGLKHALEIATDGGVSGGEIVVLENFRLRRTFATILGANLADETNPLTAGLSVSGNSFVGDTLILGDEEQREFLALFRADLPLDQTDRDAIASFFTALAHRVTVFVHNQIEPQDLGLIRRIAELESPAHVRTTVITTTAPFLVSIASLVGLDTYLRPQPRRQTVTLNRSRLGQHDILQHPASLDPRLAGRVDADLRYPIAQADLASDPQPGQSFILDASRSQAFAGRHIARYRWTWVDTVPP